MRHFSKIIAAVGSSLVFVATGFFAQTKPQRPQLDVASINGREIYANSQVGSTTAVTLTWHGTAVAASTYIIQVNCK